MNRVVFKEIEGENVFSYKHFKVPLEKQGLVHLKGNSGSGKSAIMTALDYAIYSITARGVRFKELTNIHVGRNFWIKLTLDINGVEHVTEQYRDHESEEDGIKLWRAGECVTEHMDKRAAKLYVPQVLGIDRTIFLSTIYLSQEHTHILVSGTPKEKENHLMQLFGLRNYETLIAQAKQKKDDLKDEMGNEARLREEIEDLNTQVADLPTETTLKARIAKHVDAIEQTESEVYVLEAKVSRLVGLASKLEVRDRLTEQLKELDIEATSQKDLKALHDEVDQLTEDVADLKSKVDLARKAKQIRDELESYQQGCDVEETQDKISDLTSRKTLLSKVTLPEAEKAKDLRRKLSKVQETRYDADHYEAQLTEVEASISQAQRKIKDYHSQLKKGICPTCKRPWHLDPHEADELRERLQATREELDRLNKERFTTKSLLERSTERGSLKKQLDKLTDRHPDDVEFEIREVVRDLKNLGADLTMALRRRELEASIKDAPTESTEALESRRQKLGIRLKQKRAQLKDQTKARGILDQIADLPDGDLVETENQLDEAKNVLKNARESLDKSKRLRERAIQQTKDLGRLNRELKKLKEGARASRLARRDARIWDTVGKGFAHLLKQRERDILEKLTQKIPNYMHPMFGADTKWLKVDLCKERDGVDLRLKSVGKVIPQKGISPGQRSKLGIASVFALRDLYDTGANLLIMDEPLAGVDLMGLEGFVDILKEVKKRVGTLILISHESDIKGLPFDHVWEASISNGESKVAVR